MFTHTSTPSNIRYYEYTKLKARRGKMSSLQIIGVTTVVGFALFCVLLSWIANRQSSKDEAEVQIARFNNSESIGQEQTHGEQDQVPMGA